METVNLQLDALGPIKEIPIQSLREKQHEAFLEKAKKYFEYQLEKGFEPKPTYENCMKCRYSNWCQFKITTPPVITIKPE